MERIELGVPVAFHKIFDTQLLFILIHSHTLSSPALPLRCLHGADVFIGTDVSAELSGMALNPPPGDCH